MKLKHAEDVKIMTKILREKKIILENSFEKKYS